MLSPGQLDINCQPYLNNLRNNEINAVTVSRISPEKGLEWLAFLANKCKEMTLPVIFTLIGPYLDEKYYQNISLKLVNAGVRLAGTKKGKDLCQSYLDSDVLVMPSPQEGFPLVSTEGLRHSRPVLAKAIPPHVEMFGLFSENPGVLVTDKNNALACEQAMTFIQNLASSLQLRKRLYSISSSGSLLFNPERLADKFTETVLAI